jgi:hypothetical protein
LVNVARPLLTPPVRDVQKIAASKFIAFAKEQKR